MTGFVPPSFKMDACVEIATSSYPIHRLDNIGVLPNRMICLA